MTELTLNQAIIKIRVELQLTNIKKSGKNKFAGFDYFELADFLPTLNQLMLKYDINDQFSIRDGEAVLTLCKDKEFQYYKMPFIMFETPLNSKGQKSMQDIQYLGALNTYYKRYLYLNAFGITDGEVIDAMDNTTITAPKKEEPKKNEPKNMLGWTAENLNETALDWLMDKFGEINQKGVDTLIDATLKKYPEKNPIIALSGIAKEVVRVPEDHMQEELEMIAESEEIKWN